MLKDAKYCFGFVRDIPFRIPLTADEPDYCCSGKHEILYSLLHSAGLKVRYKVFEFLWETVNLPETVEKVHYENLCTHTHLEVYNQQKGKWIIVDATWDNGLSKIFKINEWDGENDMNIPFKPTKIYSPEESKTFVESETKEEVIKDLKINGEFYKVINEWLESVRQQVDR